MSSYSASATVVVEKATSDLLLDPDWTTNMEICDAVNSHHWQAKDVVKSIKRRLQHKSHRVQLLALTLLETLVKNCGDHLHFYMAEKNIMGEMVKIVKKKADIQVRDKILGLVDSWQEAFGGAGGKYPQYYWAYEELRRFGLDFPQRSVVAGPVITPPASTPTLRQPHSGYGIPPHATNGIPDMAYGMPHSGHGIPHHSGYGMPHAGYGMPHSSGHGIPHSGHGIPHSGYGMPHSDYGMTHSSGHGIPHSDYGMTHSGYGIIPNVGYGMPSGSSRRLDEAMTAEKECLSLESMRDVMDLLRDMLQAVDPSDHLAVRDEVIVDLVEHCRSNQKKLMQMLTTTGDEQLLARGLELNDCLQTLLAKHDAIESASPLTTPGASDPIDTNPKSSESKDSSSSSHVGKSPIDEEDEEEDEFAELARRHSKPETVATDHDDGPESRKPSSSDATAAASKPTKEQDIIDLLSITLSTPLTPPPPLSDQGMSPSNNYIAPWAHPGQQPQPQPPPPHSPGQGCSAQPQREAQPNSYAQMQPPSRPQYSQYPPPPWATSPDNELWTPPRANANTPERSLDYSNSIPARLSNGAGESEVASSASNLEVSRTQKPFVPSYRLFGKEKKTGNVGGPSLSEFQAQAQGK